MYRYLFEEKCFSRILESNKKIDFEMRRRIRDLLANILGVDYERVELSYYKKTEKGLEIKFETEKDIEENFVFRVVLKITEMGTTLISLETFISRTTPIYLSGPVPVEDLLYNIIQEISKTTFYQDLMSEYKLRYEEVSKRIYEGLEILFYFSQQEENKEQNNFEGESSPGHESISTTTTKTDGEQAQGIN